MILSECERNLYIEIWHQWITLRASYSRRVKWTYNWYVKTVRNRPQQLYFTASTPSSDPPLFLYRSMVLNRHVLIYYSETCHLRPPTWNLSFTATHTYVHLLNATTTSQSQHVNIYQWLPVMWDHLWFTATERVTRAVVDDRWRCKIITTIIVQFIWFQTCY